MFLSLNWPELNLKSTINWMWVGVRDRFYILTSYNEKNSLLKSFKKILKDCPVWVRVAESIALTPEVLWRLGEWWLRQRDLKGRKSLSYLFGWGQSFSWFFAEILFFLLSSLWRPYPDLPHIGQSQRGVGPVRPAGLRP